MSDERITQLLADLSDNHGSAAEQLLPVVYEELRVIARNLMRRESSANTFQPTALVNEACVRLLGATQISWQDRAHFFAIAAQAMRQILASHARAKGTAKRSPPGRRVTLSEAPGKESDVDLLALDEALTRLAELNPRHSRLIELRFFGGMSMEEAAHVLGVSVITANRDWRVAKAWLSAQIKGGNEPGEAP